MFTHLQPYTRPAHFADFADFDRRDYYVAYTRHRDSDTLTESNWRVILAALGGESDTVLVVRDSHCMVGWVESIYIHTSDETRAAAADAMLARIADYPALDEDDWSSLEYDRAGEYWARASVSERLDWCRRYRVSIFAARRDYVPEDPSGELIGALAR